MYRHLMHATSMLGALIFALASALALLLTLGLVSAAAAPPEEKFNLVGVDDEFVDPFLTEQCGFTVLHTVVGTVKESGFVDETGTFVVTQARFRLQNTLVGPTGATLTYPDVGVDKIVTTLTGRRP